MQRYSSRALIREALGRPIALARARPRVPPKAAPYRGFDAGWSKQRPCGASGR